MDREEIRTRIEREIEALRQASEAGRDARAPVELDQTRQGRLSRMDAMQGQAMARASEARLRVRIRALQAALVRIEAGDYGECAECGNGISEARLRADPAAMHCVECAGRMEGQQ